jgi:hypothetical protein
MDIVMKGTGHCPWCGKPVRVINMVGTAAGTTYHDRSLCDLKRYLVIGADPEDRSVDGLSVVDELTGELVFGRRSTLEERQHYQEQQKAGEIVSFAGQRFSVGYMPHLSRCARWNGRPFTGLMGPDRRRSVIVAEPVPDEVAYEEQQIMLGI